MYALHHAMNGSCHPKKVPDGHEEDKMAFIVKADALIYPFSWTWESVEMSIDI